MRVLVCGGRHYDNRAEVYRRLDFLNSDPAKPVALILHGGATGADTLADNWALERGVPRLSFPVSKQEWRTIGRKAGPLRNKRMLEEGKPDVVVAFPGNTGTEDMVGRARSKAVPVIDWR